MVYRALIKTHHMTSRKKIAVLTKSAVTHHCTVLLKTGSPPGVMLCEGKEPDVRSWVDTVKNLRYKDYQLLGREAVDSDAAGLAGIIGHGNVREVEKLKAFGTLLAADEGLLVWWKKNMGFGSGE